MISPADSSTAILDRVTVFAYFHAMRDIERRWATVGYLLFHLVSLLNRRLLLCNQCVYVQSLAVIESGSLGEQNVCSGDGHCVL